MNKQNISIGEIPSIIWGKASQQVFLYILEHPITKWRFPTLILYGENDNLVDRDIEKSLKNNSN